MQAFKTKVFARWADSEGLGDDALAFAVAEMEQGLKKSNGPSLKLLNIVQEKGLEALG